MRSAPATGFSFMISPAGSVHSNPDLGILLPTDPPTSPTALSKAWKREKCDSTLSICRYPHLPHGGAVFADGITSANVVGYQTKEILANDYTMFGIQFQGTDGEGVKLGDLAINANGGGSSADADNILVWEDGVYTYYYYGVYGNSKHPEWDNIWYSMSDIDPTNV